ncbi:phosphatase PAP2 family protein [Vulgatibacter incomptus]|uniref:Phosphoesterase PA-phosphatase related protein n=1 Tax=Vulgatibacter incomptus TaxID=1391653 RepID=A0A0K1PEN6_9BACT|nr:phosphatase PAP2 family protein [Vulgatibacter incomptus]AKU91876.1 phosphoesterase PA-phosphatase related protein [Vulgatibacter incomptus]
MSRSSLAALALAASMALHAGGAKADELRYDLVPDGAITLGAVGLLAADRLLQPSLAPDHCNFCGGNAFDRSLTESLRWEDHSLAAKLSDLGAFVLLPASAMGYAFIAGGGHAGLRDTLVLVETTALTIVAVDAIKYSVARQRPMVLYLPETEPARLRHPREANVSFPSGHSAIAFELVATTATLADLHGRDPLPIWLVGLPIASTVAYLRVAGVWHWTTDVLAGAAIGTAAGAFLPRLLHGRSDRRASSAGTTATPLVLGGTW